MKDGKRSDSVLGVDIKIIQAIELDILLEFDRICKKHSLNYQLYSGTLIGAIRHKGFIPWDDDVDVCMLREDYDKFLSLAEAELGDNYFLQTHETDPNYINKYGKIRRNGTFFMEKLVVGEEMHHGMYIDIFAFDNIEPHTEEGMEQIKQLQNIDSFFKYRLKARFETLEEGPERDEAKRKYDIIKNSPVKKLTVENWALGIMTRFNHKKTQWVGDLANPSSAVLDNFMMKRSQIEDSIDWEFEGHKLPVPRDYHEILTRAYGDYMTPPDKLDRVSHHNIMEIRIDEDVLKDIGK
nr:LicD family protein [Tissierella sp.]